VGGVPTSAGDAGALSSATSFADGGRDGPGGGDGFTDGVLSPGTVAGAGSRLGDGDGDETAAEDHEYDDASDADEASEEEEEDDDDDDGEDDGGEDDGASLGGSGLLGASLRRRAAASAASPKRPRRANRAPHSLMHGSGALHPAALAIRAAPRLAQAVRSERRHRAKRSKDAAVAAAVVAAAGLAGSPPGKLLAAAAGRAARPGGAPHTLPMRLGPHPGAAAPPGGPTVSVVVHPASLSPAPATGPWAPAPPPSLDHDFGFALPNSGLAPSLAAARAWEQARLAAAEGAAAASNRRAARAAASLRYVDVTIGGASHSITLRRNRDAASASRRAFNRGPGAGPGRGAQRAAGAAAEPVPASAALPGTGGSGPTAGSAAAAAAAATRGAAGAAAAVGAWKTTRSVPWLGVVGRAADEHGVLQPVRRVEDSFELGEKVGDGGYAVVRFGARRPTPGAPGDPAPSARCAIKCIRKRFLTTEEERQCVLREVSIHRALRHKRIVRLWDAFEDDGFAYLVMERVEGGTLHSHLRAERLRVAKERRRLQAAPATEAARPGPTALPPAARDGLMTEATARRVTEQLLAALAYLHGRDILHADLKPDNILLQRRAAGADDKGRSRQFESIKLCDFGHARPARDARYYHATGDVRLVPFETVLGTAGYIAPEVLSQKPYSPSIDLWAVGVILYEMVAGYPPFRPSTRCLCDELTFPDRGWRGVSEHCRDLCRRLLSVDPKRRMGAQQALEHKWFES